MLNFHDSKKSDLSSLTLVMASIDSPPVIKQNGCYRLNFEFHENGNSEISIYDNMLILSAVDPEGDPVYFSFKHTIPKSKYINFLTNLKHSLDSKEVVHDYNI